MSGNKCDSVVGAKCLIILRKCSFSKLHLNGSADKQLFGVYGEVFLPLWLCHCKSQLEGFLQAEIYPGWGVQGRTWERVVLTITGAGAGGWRAEQEMFDMPSGFKVF